MKFQKYYEKQLELIYTRLKKQNETEEGREGRKKQGLGKLSKAQLSAVTSGELHSIYFLETRFIPCFSPGMSKHVFFFYECFTAVFIS
jgi:hypothetical protein